ncbi:hypothetical protein C7S15_8563 [Burkholderia cepacia]|nr:hypothetical protein [Burkholderia cepacia]
MNYRSSGPVSGVARSGLSTSIEWFSMREPGVVCGERE